MNFMYFSGILFSLILVLSFGTIFVISEADAQVKLVAAKSTSFEKTTIIEFENNSDDKIETLRMWLIDDFNFKSFKTENGWTGKKTTLGVIVFTPSTPLEYGEKVKIGIKSDKANPGINWKVLDKNDEVIESALTYVSESMTSENSQETTKPKTGIGIFEESVFKIIPDKPKVGASIRVAGDNFGKSQTMSFHINEEMIETFETDENGSFMFTTKIPDNQQADRANFIVKDIGEAEKIVSLRIGEADNRMSSVEEKRLTIAGLSDTIYRGEKVTISGTATPDSVLTATIKDTDGEIITTITVSVDIEGNWNYEEIIPNNTVLGERTAEITDGTNTIIRKYTVVSSEIIKLTPIKLKFEPGESLIFNGTAKPNEELELVLEDPKGAEFDSQIINVNSEGTVDFEFTTAQSSIQGTYVLIATQGDERELILVGLGEFPKAQLIVKPNKLSYSAGEIASFEIKGPDSSTISILILDPSDKQKLIDTIVLSPGGGANYELDLEGYSSGVFSIILTRGNSQASNVFAVGLETGSGPIELRTTKEMYLPGESILLLGETGENSLLKIILRDPEGNIIKQKEAFSNKEGIFSESSFKIPLNAVSGKWKIEVSSGANIATKEINIESVTQEGLVVKAQKGIEFCPLALNCVQISGLGSVTKSIFIDIISPSNSTLETISTIAKGDGTFVTFWEIPKEYESGTYFFKISDGPNKSETSIILE